MSDKGHALDRMLDLGIMPRSNENTIKTGKISRSSRPGEVVYYDAFNKIKVITNDLGEVITVVPGRR